VIVEAVVNCGVTPLPVTMFGVTVPENHNTPAPEDALPTPKCVTVPEPPDPAGNAMVEAGETLFAVTVQAALRATATRA
jgi:hypothetical protein